MSATMPGHANIPWEPRPANCLAVVWRYSANPVIPKQPAPGVFISSGGERAGAIAGALVGSPKYSSICRTVASSVMTPTMRTHPPHPLHLSGNTP